MLLLQMQKNRKFKNVENFSKTPISLILNALEMFIYEDTNDFNNIKKILDKYKLISVGEKSILKKKLMLLKIF